MFKALEALHCFPAFILHLNATSLLPDHAVGLIPDIVGLPVMSSSVQNDLTNGLFPFLGAPEFDVIATLAPAILDPCVAPVQLTALLLRPGSGLRSRPRHHSSPSRGKQEQSWRHEVPPEQEQSWRPPS